MGMAPEERVCKSECKQVWIGKVAGYQLMYFWRQSEKGCALRLLQIVELGHEGWERHR